jgi:DNA processing protein
VTVSREAVELPGARGACTDCLRRAWLLGELSAILDLNCRADGRLFELLALDDGELIQAVGGRRRAELVRGYASFQGDQRTSRSEIAELCMHDARYPRELKSAGICPLLHVAGGVERLHELTERPVVALAGTRDASDYGLATTRDLARGLSASGVTVAALRIGGIAAAALSGALASRGATLTIAGSGLDLAPQARQRSLRAALRKGGCALSALSCGVDGRRWGIASAERMFAALASVTLVVEARASSRDLSTAHFAKSLGRPVAAIPGRVSSPASAGCHALLREGAQLIRDATDVLELLYEAGHAAPAPEQNETRLVELEPRLQTVLERVGTGADTPGKLAGEQADVGEVLRALSELELLGLLSRGDGGRYVVRVSVPSTAVRYVGCSQMEP